MMRNKVLMGVVLVILVGAGLYLGLKSRRAGGQGAPTAPALEPSAQIAGSRSCRPCHEKFYQLWSTSLHGLAMQPFTPELAGREFAAAPPAEIQAGKNSYRFEMGSGGGVVRERTAAGENSYPVLHVLGGKNVFYLLAKLDRGRLQVLPVAFDVRSKTWFDTAASAMRHFPDRRDQPVEWRDPLYTFNTSCYGCHVSQLSTNYDPQSDSYNTVWAEPGINCETCHGPSAEHVRVCREAPAGQTPADLKIIITKTFSPEQHNDSCSSCHAKASVVTNSFQPGDRFFDHFDLVTYENPDYYPDGRDLGENYTTASWLMNACAAKSKMHCVTCHTSSGRFRFAGERANESCLPCHEARVRDASPHTHHAPGSKGSQCIACHMPITEFARMRRSDHSFRPPTPAATLAFKSPNACNICHTDRDAAWADRQVRSWHRDDYQERQLSWARLVDAARKHDWRELPRMLEYLAGASRNQVVAASLVRLLSACPDERRVPALVRALKDPSPLVRASAAMALESLNLPEVRTALLAATRDEYRLVRLRAAGALAGYPGELLSPGDRQALEAAQQELVTSYKSRPDDWAGQYNLGNFYMERQEYQRAVDSFTTASRLRQDAVLPLVNAAIAHANLGQPASAEESIRRALVLEPENAAANFNLGLLKAEQGDLAQAETALRAALKADPQMASAAYNLGVLLARDRRAEAVELCRKAAQFGPGEPKYAYTLAFYLNEAGEKKAAAQELQKLLLRFPQYWDAYGLLGSIYETGRDFTQARALYRKALGVAGLPPQERQFLETRLAAIP